MLTVLLPVPVHRRFKHAVKRARETMTRITRDAIVEKTEALEQQQQLRAAPKKENLLGDIGSSPLGPSAPTTPEEHEAAVADAKQPIIQTHAPETDEELLSDLYGEQAMRLFEVLERPVEKRLRVVEALRAIQESYPLVPPSDEVILKTLQTHMLRLRAKKRDGEEIPTSPTVTRPLFLRTDEGPETEDVLPARFPSSLTGQMFDPEKIASISDE